MIKHVVCFKLMDKTEEAKKKAKEVLMSMDGEVELIRSIEVGTDFLGSQRSYDVILQVGLDDEKALEDYQNHEYHVNVVKAYMHKVIQTSIAIDYVID